MSPKKKDISDIIDMDEAMEQCGNDEEFLMEILQDFQEELTTQLRKIDLATEQVVNPLQVRSAAHVIKGSAANLFCEPLRKSAYDLEMEARLYSEESDSSFEKGRQTLMAAANDFFEMLEDMLSDKDV